MVTECSRDGQGETEIAGCERDGFKSSQTEGQLVHSCQFPQVMPGLRYHGKKTETISHCLQTKCVLFCPWMETIITGLHNENQDCLCKVSQTQSRMGHGCTPQHSVISAASPGGAWHNVQDFVSLCQGFHLSLCRAADGQLTEVLNLISQSMY